jgi:hypothetical protein
MNNSRNLRRVISYVADDVAQRTNGNWQLLPCLMNFLDTCSMVMIPVNWKTRVGDEDEVLGLVV